LRLSALVAVILFAVACDRPGGSPTAAVRSFARSARAGDRTGVYARLSPTARARLSERARTATEQTAARRNLGGAEMLAVGAAPPRWEPARIRELKRSDDRARVEVSGPEGERAEVGCVRVGGEWFVEWQEGGAGSP
jgi:hypothetical protein